MTGRGVTTIGRPFRDDRFKRVAAVDGLVSNWRSRPEAFADPLIQQTFDAAQY